jgi:dipeptidyl aminopeptidase/acylaminoacyl peptidase
MRLREYLWRPYGARILFSALPSTPPPALCWAKLFRAYGARFSGFLLPSRKPNSVLAQTLVRTGLVLVIVCCVLAVHAGELKPVATVHLPCESSSQLVSPNGEQLAVRCKDHSLRLVDIATGREQHVFPGDNPIASFSYSRDGRWFAAGLNGGWVEIVPTSGSASPKKWKADDHRIDSVQFLGGDLILVAGADQAGGIWDIRDAPKLRAGLHSDFAGLTASALSPDGKMLATADGDTVLRVYDTSSWKIAHEYRGLKLETFAVPFTSDGKHLLAGGADDHISLLDLSSGTEVHRLSAEMGYVAEILPLGDNRRAAVVYLDTDGLKPPRAVVWNLDTFNAEPLNAEHPLTGGGLVRGKLWVVSATGSSLQAWEYQ